VQVSRRPGRRARHLHIARHALPKLRRECTHRESQYLHLLMLIHLMVVQHPDRHEQLGRRQQETGQSFAHLAAGRLDVYKRLDFEMKARRSIQSYDKPSCQGGV
jgi:hypothetical protein